MTRHWWFAGSFGALLPIAAAAYPDGAPWPAGHGARSDCSACHFDSPAIAASDGLVVEGLDRSLRAGETYPVTLRLSDPDAELAGFVARFERADGMAGRTVPEEGLEADGPAIRSVRPVKPDSSTASWRFHWTAPNEPGAIIFYVAANAANGDASPFGDRIHLREWVLKVQ